MPTDYPARVSERPRPGQRALSNGEAVGPYLLGDLLGQGGMGTVYRAVHVHERTEVALKVLKASPAADGELTRRFAREARAAGEVRHPHLVEVLDAGEDDGVRYLAMRLVEGRSLQSVIRADGPLALPDLVRVMSQVAAGLDALHAAGLIHRDVKPSNILLGDDGCVSLTDFGLIKGSGYSVLTKIGQLMGTLDYLAPEAIKGEEPSAASDVYALGCVAYECACGAPPFSGGMFQVGHGHLEERPTDPCAARADASGEVAEALLLALEKDPARRPPTATSYARLLSLAVTRSSR